MTEHDAVAAGEQCPECGSTNTESNGATEYRCIDCDHRWGFDGERYGYAVEEEHDMKFIKTDFGWKAYARCAGNGYIYIGHFYTQRAARAALQNA